MRLHDQDYDVDPWAPAGFFPGGVKKLLLGRQPAAGEIFFKSCMLLHTSFSALLGELPVFQGGSNDPPCPCLWAPMSGPLARVSVSQ